MKKYILCSLISVAFLTTVCTAQKGKWTVLFDGGSTDKFRGYGMQGFPGQAWKVEHGALVTQTGVPNVDLVTKEAYKNFELEFDWKVSKAGNSGVFFHFS